MIAFDLDGTLVQDRSSWTRIHRHFGVEGAATQNMPLYENRIIDYQEFMRRDIALWPPKLHLKDVDQLLSDFVMNPQAPKVIEEIRRLNHDIALISAGLDLLANKVAKILEITTVVANGLQTDSRGYLTGKGIFRVDLLRKDIALESVLKGKGVRLDECMTIGDSKYDKTFLQRAGFGVALGKDPDLADVATFVIDELSEVVPCITSVEAKQ
jgi:phosphoserine phosphatase